MKRWIAPLLAALVGAAYLARAPSVQAVEAADAAPRPGLPAAEVVVVGEFPNADAVGPRVTSWFAGQSIAATDSRTAKLHADVVFAPSETVGVRVWVMLAAPTQARLFFAVQDQAGVSSRFLVQDVELTGGVDELGLERLAQVAYLSAVALWEGNAESSREDVERSLGVPPAPPKTPPPAAAARPSSPPKPAAKPRWGFHGSYSLEAQYHGPEGLLMGPLAGAGLGWTNDVDTRWTLDLGIRWFADPNEAEAQGATIDVSGFGYSLTTSYARPLSGRLWLHARLGPELQWMFYRIEAIDNPTLQGNVGRGDAILRPGLFASVGLGLKVESAGMLTFGASLTVPFVRTHFDIRDAQLPGGSEELLAAWPVNPGLSLGWHYF
jgi:hypothetical protein